MSLPPDKSSVLTWAVPLATHASLILARFNAVVPNQGVVPESLGGALFLNVAADVRAAGTGVDSQTAFKFALYGLHENLESAEEAVSQFRHQAPWLANAVEVWGAVLAPFRHFGEANFLNANEPAGLFEDLAPQPEDGTPILVVTSAGWDANADLDHNRLREFSDGVSAVRISMSGVPGLHSQQSFFFPGRLVTDGITVTLWKDFASMRNFAYGPGTHRNMLTRQREENLSDRTSFTRFVALSSFGTWHGTDPLS